MCDVTTSGCRGLWSKAGMRVSDSIGSSDLAVWPCVSLLGG